MRLLDGRHLLSSLFLTLVALLLFVEAVPAGEVYIKDGAAISGYDPVAYFLEHKPVQGSSALTSEFRGSVFQFASAANREAFAAEPERYAPQYGGFCAYGMAKGYKATTSPEAFTIVDGKLYLNYNLDVRDRWQKDVPGFIVQADRNWPRGKSSTKVSQ